MSSITTATLIAPIPLSTDMPDIPLLFRTSKMDAASSETSSKRLLYNGSLAKPLQFLNVTKDPEVERKLARNRRTVRSNAIKHAVQARKQAVDQRPTPAKTSDMAKDPSSPSQKERDILHRDHDSAGGPTCNLQDCASQVFTRTPPKMLWPTGTVAARTNYSELNLVSTRKQHRQSETDVSNVAHAKVVCPCRFSKGQEPLLYFLTRT